MIYWSNFCPYPRNQISDRFRAHLKARFDGYSSRVPNLPIQQIEASRDYSETNCISSPCIGGNGFKIPSPDDDMLQRARPRAPSIDENYLASTRVGSPDSDSESMQSLQCQTVLSQRSASTSRVTSWGTTSTGDTLTQRDLKRLTVIHEAKDSIESEADRLTSLSAQTEPFLLPTFTAFRDPMSIESQTGESSLYINPKRIFSALMREIDTTKSTPSQTSVVASTPAADDGLFESSEMKGTLSVDRELHSCANKDPRLSFSSESRPLSSRPDSAAGNRVPGKKSSIRSFGRAIRSTIRHVTPGENRSSPYHNLLKAEHQLASISQETENEPRTTIFRGGDIEPSAVTRR
jgi:hypothetical protein